MTTHVDSECNHGNVCCALFGDIESEGDDEKEEAQEWESRQEDLTPSPPIDCLRQETL